MSGDADPPAAPADERALIRVLFCCGPDYFQHLAVALVSLCENNSAHQLDVHVISSRPDAVAESMLLQSSAKYDNAKVSICYFQWHDREKWFTSYHIKDEAYTRILASSILDPSIDKIIYLDSDLVVLGDLKGLWETDVEKAALAGAPDPFGASRRVALGMPAGSSYINSGVLVFNLARWRAQGLGDRLGVYIAREGSRLLFHDQDAINAVLHSQIKVIDYRWNVQAVLSLPRKTKGLADRAQIVEALRSPAIIHYTSSRKPWLFKMATPHKRLYWQYLQKTAWNGVKPTGRRWDALLEYAVNHAFHSFGSDYTWDRMLRSTLLGRGIDRCIGVMGMRRPTKPEPAPFK